MSQHIYALDNFLFTSESVGEGHPDKLCDQISDAILDGYLSQDSFARVAVETMVMPNKVVVAGETRSDNPLSHEAIELIIRDLVRHIGYASSGFHWRDLEIEIYLHHQSPEIAQGVDAKDGKGEGAGDQGIMFGYATDETESLMPAPIYYAHHILECLSNAKHMGTLPMLGPDAKSQVTLEYKNGRPVAAHTILVSIQHEEGLTSDDVKQLIMPCVEKVLPTGWITEATRFIVNPTGQFVLGGPISDVGLTGRKIIVDTYGGAAPHGGGAFSGKDPTKVDRSAAYAMRYLAKNVVKAGLARRVTLQIAYAIGMHTPLALYVNTHGTGVVSEDAISKVLTELMDLTPQGIREHLTLNRPIYQPTAKYGHFGRQADARGYFPWEKLDLVKALQDRFAIDNITVGS